MGDFVLFIDNMFMLKKNSVLMLFNVDHVVVTHKDLNLIMPSLSSDVLLKKSASMVPLVNGKYVSK